MPPDDSFPSAGPLLIFFLFYRPVYTVYEGLEPGQLLLNPLAPMLAMCIGSHAFRDYTTVDEVFSIKPPPEGEVHVFEWNNPDTHFMVAQSGLIQTASTRSARLIPFFSGIKIYKKLTNNKTQAIHKPNK